MRRFGIALSAALLTLGGWTGLAVIAAPPAHAQEGDQAPTNGTLYVDHVTGSDSNDCLTSTAGPQPFNGPCATIKQAVSLIGGTSSFGEGSETVDYTPVTTIVVAGGPGETYVEDNPVYVDFAGEATGNPLTIEGPPWQGSPDPTAVVQPQHPGSSLFQVGDDDASAATFANLFLKGTVSPETVPEEGGGVYDAAEGVGPTPGLTLVTDEIAGFTVSSEGGGIYNAAGASLDMQGTSVHDNTATDEVGCGCGGGISSYGAVTIGSTNDATPVVSNISSNTAADDGGAISVGGSGPALTVTGGTVIAGNQVTSSNGEGGGGIAVYSGSVVDGPLRTSGLSGTGPVFAAEGTSGVSVTVDDSTVTSNTSEGYGGGGILIDSESGTDSFTFSGDTVAGNHATTGGGGDGDGGAVNAYIYNPGSTASSLVFRQDSFTSNMADDDGGAVDFYYGGSNSTAGTALFAQDVFSGNTAAANGGAIDTDYVPSESGITEPGTQLVNDVIGGSEECAGAVRGLTFPAECGAGQNTATWGGGIYNEDLMTVTGSSIAGNEATDDGGGILSTRLGTISSSSITGNAAGEDGGGLSMEGDPQTITDTTIADNVAGTSTPAAAPTPSESGGNGGGLAFSEGSGTYALGLDDDTIYANQALQSTGADAGVGAGVYVPGTGGDVTAEGTLLAANNDGRAGDGDIVPSLDNCSAPITDAGYNEEDDVPDGTAQCGFSVAGHDVLSATTNVNEQTKDLPLATLPSGPVFGAFAATGLVAGGVPAIVEAPTGNPPETVGGSQCSGFNGGTDEVGSPRGNGSSCDIGAVQVSPNVGGGGGGGGVSTGGGVQPESTGPTVTQVGGPGRVGTAVLASQLEFPTGGAGAVVLARDDLFPDGLTGVPFAVAKHAPLLLSDPHALSPATATEISRVLAKGGTVYLLGETDALSTEVESAVQALGYTTQRVGGATRYDTAVSIANALGSPTTVFEADGLDFPDALSAGSAATLEHGAILLTQGTVQSPQTASYLGSVKPTTKYALGGPAAAADSSATPIVGSDRYATSAMVAAKFFPKVAEVGAATGRDFADALTGGVTVASANAPLLLVDPSFTSVAALPSTLWSYLQGLDGTVTQIVVFGGTNAVPAAVAQTLQAAA